MKLTKTEIKELVKLLESSKLSVLEIEQDGCRVRLEKNGAAVQHTSEALPVQIPTTPSASAEGEKPAQKTEGGKVLKAPMVGTFHPLEKDKIKVGTKLKKGQPICIIEAMKLMNEITMEEDGEIVSLEAKDGDMVEFGQALFFYK